MAGNFLFTRDDLDKSISMLSGGERARLCLAAICLGKYDVLILDEPTNHLDFDTVEALGEALGSFPGTVIFVSHDRTFVAQIATSILEIKNGRARRYPYPYEIYVYELQTHETFEMQTDEGAIDEGTPPYLRRKADVYEDIQKEKRLLKRTEEQMGDLSKEKEEVLKAYAENPMAQSVQRAKRLKEIDAEVLALESGWFTTQDRLTAFENELKTARLEHG